MATETAKQCMKNWKQNNKEHCNEYMKNYIHERSQNDEEFKLHRRELCLKAVRLYREKLKAKKIADGILPKKRGPKSKDVKPSDEIQIE
jgi:hypothetical protein